MSVRWSLAHTPVFPSCSACWIQWCMPCNVNYFENSLLFHISRVWARVAQSVQWLFLYQVNQGTGFGSWQEQRSCYSPDCWDWLWCLPSLTSRSSRGCVLASKQGMCEVVDSPESGAEVKNAWHYYLLFSVCPNSVMLHYTQGQVCCNITISAT